MRSICLIPMKDQSPRSCKAKGVLTKRPSRGKSAISFAQAGARSRSDRVATQGRQRSTERGNTGPSTAAPGSTLWDAS